MKKSFLLKGLDCASCAAKIRDQIAALDGVSGATLGFATGKLVIDGDEDKMDTIAKAAGKIIRKLEPDVVMEGK